MFAPADLTVVIPTRDRWTILARTLAALRHQTVTGFETIVVVDGDDQEPVELGPGIRVMHQPQAGPGAARNRATRATTTPLVLFLGDDMIPDPGLVAAHLDAHRRDPAPEGAVLGRVEWHPEVERNRLHRWLDWSATLFNYCGVEAGVDAHWTRFYSCNVSLKRDYFLDAGGFDEDFVFYYEDLDCGWRLGEKGLHLVYEPAATTRHLHQYDWDRLVRRFDGIAVGEHMMAAKHPDFDPFFRMRCEHALSENSVSPLWTLVADRLPPGTSLRAAAERRANRWWYGRLAPRYLNLYRAADELAELRAYLGDEFDLRKLYRFQAEVEAEAAAAADEATFYRTSQAYLYDLTVFAMSPTKLPYREDLARLVPAGARLLDYGCGIGADGLRLIERGYHVAFADFDNPSTQYLRWRLARRGIVADVFDIDHEVEGGFDAVYCFDVLEHVDDPFALLRRIEGLAQLVVVNLVASELNDTHLHKPLDIPELLTHAERRGLVHYRRYHDRVHLVAYRSNDPRPSPTRGRLNREVGAAKSLTRTTRDHLFARIGGAV